MRKSMQYFPLCINLENKKCLVIGAGKIAYQKLMVLSQFKCDITVISEKICKEILDLNIKIIQKSFELSDVNDEYALVVDATGDASIGDFLSKKCKKLRIPLNVVDNKDKCSFIFPAIYKNGDLTVAVNTNGKSPTVATWVKNKVKDEIGENFDEIFEQMSEIRVMLKKEIPVLEDRITITKEILEKAMCLNRKLTDEEIENIIRG